MPHAAHSEDQKKYSASMFTGNICLKMLPMDLRLNIFILTTIRYGKSTDAELNKQGKGTELSVTFAKLNYRRREYKCNLEISCTYTAKTYASYMWYCYIYKD